MKFWLSIALCLLLVFGGVSACALADTTGNGELNGEDWDDDIDWSDDEVDAQIPDDYDEDYDDEIDMPRTIQAATAADVMGDVKADYVISNTSFATQMDEIAVYSEDYLGKAIMLIGYVMRYEADENEQAEFAIVRDFQMLDHEHEEGEVVDHDHDDEVYPVGIDCHYEGDALAEGSWVKAIGTLTEYEYIDEDGETFEALMLAIAAMETIPETEGGSRTVSE